MPQKTVNTLPRPVRDQVAEVLQARLADAIDLMQQVKHAHWNVRGPQFISLHELFDKVTDEIAEHADDLAERAAALGHPVQGTCRSVALQSSMHDYPAANSGKAHVRAVANALAQFGGLTRKAIDTTAALGDPATADLFTAMTRSLDKALWLVEAHLQSA